MAKSVPDTFFTERRPNTLPADFMRPLKPNINTCVKLYLVNNLKPHFALFYGGYSATFAKGNAKYLINHAVTKAYLDALGLDDESVKTMTLSNLRIVNERFKDDIISGLHAENERANMAREIRQNYETMYKMAGGIFRTELTGKDGSPIEVNHRGGLDILLGGSNGGTGDSDDSSEE